MNPLTLTFKDYVDETVTLTVHRVERSYAVDITVVLRHIRDIEGDYWFVIESVDERGVNTPLTQKEILQVKTRARAGEDETGR